MLFVVSLPPLCVLVSQSCEAVLGGLHGSLMYYSLPQHTRTPPPPPLPKNLSQSNIPFHHFELETQFVHLALLWACDVDICFEIKEISHFLLEAP